MAVVFTDEAMQRIEEARRERASRLAREGNGLEVSPDHVLPGAWIVRDPARPGIVHIVTAGGRCSCQRYRVWDRCPHVARVEELYGETA